jgi:hypothetical protein
MMKCVICKRGPLQGVTVFRINAKGQPGLWACKKHIGQTDAPPIDPVVDEIVSIIGRSLKQEGGA